MIVNLVINLLLEHKGVTIFSKFNNEDIGTFNNQRFKIIEIGTFTITFEDALKKVVKNNILDFQKYFLAAYATTTHSTHWSGIAQ